MKVKFFDGQLIKWFYGLLSAVSVVTSIVFLFVELAPAQKAVWGLVSLAVFLLIYIGLWIHANVRSSITLKLNGGPVDITFGDMFGEEECWKAVAFNEYFDTQVDDVVISKQSLHGKFINRYFNGRVQELDAIIDSDRHLHSRIAGIEPDRDPGKKIKYRLGSVCAAGEFMLTALSHFDDEYRAYTNMHDYVSFLLNFWQEVDRVYSGKTVVIPLFGAGITRFRGAESDMISDQKLLEMILWSFRASRIKFAHGSRLKIMLSVRKRDKINLHALKALEQ